MNTVKWELEDLAFATLYPKRYDEIVRLVAERAPSRDTYLARGGRARLRRPARGPGQGDGDRPAEALLLDLPEDDRPRPRLHRHLRPGRHPGPGRLGARLLRGARRDPRDLAAGPGPVQGLHRDAEVQHVPVAAHDGDRPGGQAGRAADPHPGHAPHRRVRHRRALEVQGDQGRRRRRPAAGRRDGAGCASCSTGSGRRRSRGSSWTRCASTSAPARCSSSPRRATSSRCRPAPPRSTSRTRCTPRSATAASAPGSTAGWSRWSPRWTTATPSRSSPPSPRPPARPGTGWRSSRARGRRPRSGSGSPRSGARTRSRPARTRSAGRCARPACRCSGCSAATR